MFGVTLDSNFGAFWKNLNLAYVENAETYSTGGVHVGVKEGRHKFTLWGLRGVLFGKLKHHLVQATLPVGAGLSRNARSPLHQVAAAISRALWLGEEAVRVVLPAKLKMERWRRVSTAAPLFDPPINKSHTFIQSKSFLPPSLALLT